jgi:hypothetical protein
VYRKRWGIETCFFVLKSYLQLTNFSAYTVNNCWQDIYSHFIFYNIESAFFAAHGSKIRSINRRRQHDYKPNRNVTAGLLKDVLVKVMLCSEAECNSSLKDFSRQLLQQMEPIRPNKNKVRKRKIFRNNERHAHEKNYRSAL